MKITITSTSKLVHVNGVPARIWEGHTDSGIPVHCYVTRIAAPIEADTSQFERELTEHATPTDEVRGIPMRLIL